MNNSNFMFKIRFQCLIWYKLFFFIILANLSWADNNPLLHGSLEYKNFSHFHGKEQNSNAVRNEGILVIKLEGKIGKKLYYLFVPKVSLDDDHLSEGIIDGLKDDDEKRKVLKFEEAYVKFRGERFDLSIGQQIYSWGKADGFNPTDTINPKDYLDLLDEEKLGVFSSRLKYYYNNSSVELVVIPFFMPSKLPLPYSRWSFIPSNFSININERILPTDSNKKNIQFGVKFSTNYRGFDFSLIFYDGIYNIPVYIFNNGRFARVYPKIKVFGGDFSTSFRKIELHGEIAQFVSDTKKYDSFLQFVFGIIYLTNEPFYNRNLTLTLEYAKEKINFKTTNPNIILNSNLFRPFKNSLLAKAMYEITNFTKLIIIGVYNFEAKDFYLQPKLSCDITDSFTVEGGIDILQGSYNTYFGKFNDNDRLFLKLKYTF